MSTWIRACAISKQSCFNQLSDYKIMLSWLGYHKRKVIFSMREIIQEALEDASLFRLLSSSSLPKHGTLRHVVSARHEK